MSCSLIPIFPSLFDLFGSRPTMAATYDIATILSQYTNPSLRMLSLGAAKLMFIGTPISSPSIAADFGPFYNAALYIEIAIRWGAPTASVINVENQTLGNALHEAGNPGVAGNTTLSVMEQVYHDYLSGKMGFQANPTDFSSVKPLAAVPPVQDAASLLKFGWANQFLKIHPSSV